MTKEKMDLNRTQIKYIAIISMLIDHTAALLLPPEKYPALTVLYVLMRTVGRIAGPVMLYFLAEGYRYTSSKLKYGLRLLCFGILSQIPYSLVRYSEISLRNLNVVITLLLSFIMLVITERVRNEILNGIVVFFFMVLTIFSDWGILGPLMVWLFYVYRENRKEQIKSYICLCMILIAIPIIMVLQGKVEWYEGVYQIGMFLTFLILRVYNGEAGKKGFLNKWAFYMFYPLHLQLFWLIMINV